MTNTPTIRKRVGLFAVAAGSTLALGSIALGGVAQASKPDDTGTHKVTICHAVSGLGETKHGYNIITVDVASIFSGAHPTHVHAGRHDIIPAFDYTDKDGDHHFEGLGDASWIATGCAAPGDSVPPSTTPECNDGDSSSSVGHDDLVAMNDDEGEGGDNEDCGTTTTASTPPSTTPECDNGDSSSSVGHDNLVAMNDDEGEGGDNEDCGTTTTASASTGSSDVTTTTAASTGSSDVTTTTAASTGSSDVTTTTAASTGSSDVTTTTAASTGSSDVTTTTAAKTVGQGGPVPPAVADASGSLPSTGSSQTVFLVLGLLMVLGGVVFVIMSRRPDEA